MASADADLSDLPSEVKDNSTSDLVEGFNNLNLWRQVGLMVGIAASVAIGFAVVLWSQEEDYRPLYGSLDRLDSSEVVDILDLHGIKFKLDQSGALLVESDKILDARMKLAEAGIPGDRSAGFELLDQEQPLGTSQFMENARYRRGLEGELARTIASINTVRSARVHLAIPKHSVFVRDAREPRASVFVEVFPGRGVKVEQVKAISNLVASSIPELKLENVTVVDQRGNLLSVGDESEDLQLAAKQREHTRKIEADITQRINRILEPIVGPDNYKAEVSADVDFTEVEQAEEIFNPDLPAMRSEQTLDEQGTGNNQVAGIPGALTNQPPGAAQVPEQVDPAAAQGEGAPAGRVRRQATRNFELDRTVSYTKHQMGKLRRLTVAVVVNDKVQTDVDNGEQIHVPWTENELERLAILVRDAVGYSAARGDSVNVLNSPFMPKEEIVLADPPWWKQAWFLSLMKQVVGVVFILFLVLGLLRPILKSLVSVGRKAKEEQEARELRALEEAGVDGYGPMGEDSVTLTGGDSLALPSPDMSYENQLTAVKGIIAEDPGRVAQVIKRWINQDD